VGKRFRFSYQLSTKNYQLVSAADERIQIGILTSGFNLAPAFPAESASGIGSL